MLAKLMVSSEEVAATLISREPSGERREALWLQPGTGYAGCVLGDVLRKASFAARRRLNEQVSNPV